MIIDMQQPFTAHQVTVMPDWVFADNPKQSPIIEEIFIEGTTSCVTDNVTGTIDD
jgi:hypothetical protein